jgi:hypothetical protein
MNILVPDISIAERQLGQLTAFGIRDAFLEEDGHVSIGTRRPAGE